MVFMRIMEAVYVDTGWKGGNEPWMNYPYTNQNLKIQRKIWVNAFFCVIRSGVDMEPLSAWCASLAAALKYRADSQSGYHTDLSI